CSVLFFFTTPPPPETSTLSLHDALPILVEGATAAVLVKQHFAGVAPRFVVNLAVALVSGAPAFSNVLSFVWANLAHGRARVRLMVALQAGFALLVGCVSFASRAAGGLLITVASIVSARVL